MNKTMTRKNFIKYAEHSVDICIPVMGRKGRWEFVSLGKGFLEALKNSRHIKSIEFDQVRDVPESTIWLHTPNYPEVEEE